MLKVRKVLASFLVLLFLVAWVNPSTKTVEAHINSESPIEAISPNKRPLPTTRFHESAQSQAVLPPKDPQNVVYLTFDDGPDPNWTIQILDILERYQAGATFYMIGYNVVSHPEVVREVATRGQTLSVHGFNHFDLSGVGFAYFYNEIHDTETVILDALGEDPALTQQFGRCMRPPYGKKSELLATNAEAMGYEVSMWNIDTKDWSGLSPGEILTHFRSALEPNKVILMHDGGLERSNTVKALELILHELLMQGFTALPYCTQEGQAIDTSD